MSGIRQTGFGALVGLLLVLASRDITLDGRLLVVALALVCVVGLACTESTPAA